MKKIILFLAIFNLILGCTGLDPKIGTTFDNSIPYNRWLDSKTTISWEMFDLKMINYDVKSNHTTILFNIIKKEAQGRNRSFNSRVEYMSVEFTFNFYLLDENQTCYDKVFKFKRVSQFPRQMSVDIPHDKRLTYIAPQVGIQWWVQH